MTKKRNLSIDGILCCTCKTQRNSQFCFGETPIWIANWISRIKIFYFSYFDFNYCWSTCKQHADLSFFWNSHLNEYRIYKIQCKYFRVHSAENRWNNFGHKQPKLSICIDLWWNSTSYPKMILLKWLKLTSSDTVV